MDNKQKLFTTLIIFIIAIVLLLIYNNANQEKNETMSPEEAIEQVQDDIVVDEPPVQIQQGKVVGIKDEKKEWEIEAESITIAEDREKTIFTEIKKMQIFKEEKPYLTITAESCIANMQNKDMELNGNVVISTEDGDSLSGKRVLWHSEEQRISSQEKVELQVDNHYIIAGGLSTNMEMTQLELTNRVTVIIKL